MEIRLKKINLKSFVAFILVLQLLVGPLGIQKHANAMGTVQEGMVHQFSSNTWAYSRLANGPSGQLYLSHVKTSGSEIVVKKWGNGSWSQVTSITPSMTGDSNLPGPSDITIDANGRIHAAFLFSKGSGSTSYRGVKYGVYQNGSWTFQTVEAYSDPNGWKNISDPSIAVDSNGKAHLAYVYNDANDPRKYEIHYATNQSGSWSTKNLVTGTSATDEVKTPQVEVDGADTVHITYVKEDNQNNYYGNYYYTHKKVSDASFPPAEKIVNAVGDQKDYVYEPFVVDDSGKMYFTFHEGDFNNPSTFISYYQTNQSGTWQREVVYTDTQKITTPISISLVNSKPTLLMYSESWDWPPSQKSFFAMEKDGGTWTKGTNEVYASLLDSSAAELAYAVDTNGNFVAVMENWDLRNVSFISGSREDFGLTPNLSNNADLSNLTLSSATLTPAFDPGTTSYSASVGYEVQSIEITPTVAEAYATITVDGTAVASGNASMVNLTIGTNPITVVVTAQDGTTKTYTITVERAAASSNSDLSNLTVSEGTLSPSFATTTTQYQVSVPYITDILFFTPTAADFSAAITVEGIPVTSGTASFPIGLQLGENSIPVVVTSASGSSTTYTVVVKRNQAPIIAYSDFSVDENAQPGTAVGKINASDADGDTLSYRIASGNSNIFKIDEATGEITVADGSLLDYESMNSYWLSIEVSDGIDKSYSDVFINVKDVNDNSPIPTGFFDTWIMENSANGTAVGYVTAWDPDMGSHFAYSITAGNETGAFAIDSSSGVVTVADSTKLDYETVKSFTLTVQVSDGVNTADTTATIYLENVNDNKPVAEDATFNVNENASDWSWVGTVHATDADGDPVYYSILSGNETGAFTINSYTGDITVADGSQLDYEKQTSYQLTVQASDTFMGQPLSLSPYELLTELSTASTADTDTATITINVNDVNDNSPVPQGFTTTLDENTANGTTVGTVMTTDADTGSQFTYQITEGNEAGAFAIDGSTGEVTVADSTKLDYEMIKSFTLTVQVSDGINLSDTTVTIQLNNLNDNTPVVQNATFTVDENAGNGTILGAVTGSDADGDPLSYSIISGNEDGAFSINSTTGEVTVADGSLLDYETKTTYQLTIKVSDTLVPNVFASPFLLLQALNSTTGSETATITISVQDLNDNTPVPQGFTKNLDENTASGTGVGMVTATDADAGTTFSYSIVTGNVAGAFTIDANTGEITVADGSQLDYEKVKSFALTVQVSDGTYTANTTVTLNLNNLNDNSPIADNKEFSIDENAGNGTEVGAVVANDLDGDSLSHSFTGGNESGAFALDAASGKITVADQSQLDYEAVKNFTLTVEVSDGGHTSELTVLVHINNVNDNIPVVKAGDFSIDENSANGTEVGTIEASDADGDTLSYQVMAGNDAGAFKVDAATGKISVADSSQLDYEQVKEFVLTVQASDGTHTADTTVTIHVTNLNDNAPTVENKEVTIDENLSDRTEVVTVAASDADGDTLSYTLTGGNGAGAFALDATTGEISVANSSQLDYETVKSFTLTVQVSDGTNTADSTVTINLRNVNDNKPVVKNATFNVNENAAEGLVLGTVHATDADGDKLFYSILSGNEEGAFAIDSNTGEIVVRDGSQLDYEQKTAYQLTVQASDTLMGQPLTNLSPYELLLVLSSASMTETDKTTITINVNDLNDNLPVPQGFTKNVDENAANGSSVGMVTATDADAGTVFTYSIVSGNEAGAFAINANTGEVTVADGDQLDYETVKSFTLTVRVSDGTHTADTTVTLNLNNLNDNSPIADDKEFSIDENAGNGTEVGAVVASDMDGDSLSYSLTGGNELGAFALDVATGKITVANHIPLDYEAVKSFTLNVQVSDKTHTAELTVLIHVHNINDNTPVVKAGEFSVGENSAKGTEVGTVDGRDADGDSLTYSIISGNEAGAFTLDAETGKITVANGSPLDYEQVKELVLTVQASDGTHTADTNVTVHVTNLNDNAPKVENKEVTIDENLSAGTEVGTVSASDADGDTLSYSVASGNDAGAFALDAMTGKITVADQSKIDYETVKEFTFTVEVSDGIHTSELTVLVHVNNLNDNTPVTKAGEFSIDENSENGTEVGTVEVSDADGDPLSYQVIAGNDAGAFTVDAATGKISVADGSQLDYETVKSFSLSIQVSDGVHTADVVEKIELNNLNDNIPVVKDATFSVDENAVNGTEVGTVEARDADGSSLSYAFFNGNQAGVFTIDPSTGKITVADGSQLDYETIKSFKLAVQVSDGAHQKYLSVNIELNNLNDNTPVAEDKEFTISDHAANGTAVGTVESSDTDGDVVTYTISAGNDDGIFKIDSATGEMTVADASLLDAGVKGEYALTVEVSDGQHKAAVSVTVHVLSSDATLTRLDTSVGDLIPAFEPGTTHYRVMVGEDTHEIKLKPTAANANAIVSVNGELLLSGQTSKGISLSVGLNTITVLVTAQNGQTATYTIDVVRLQKVVTTKTYQENGIVMVQKDDVDLLDDHGTLVVELKKNLDSIESVQFPADQLNVMIEKNAKIKVVKNDVELLIPAINFAKGEGLTISLERMVKEAKKLPFSDLVKSAVYDFTVKQGNRIISHFDHEVEIHFPTDGVQVKEPKDLGVYYWNVDQKEWKTVTSKYENDQVKAWTSHFTTFAVFYPSDLVKKESSSDSELPGTATNIYNWIYLGILLLILGGTLYRRKQRDGSRAS